MSELKFTDEQQTVYSSPPKRPKDSGFSRFLIKYSGGLIKTEKQASLALLVIALVGIFITINTFFGSDEPDFEPNTNPATGEPLPGEI